MNTADDDEYDQTNNNNNSNNQGNTTTTSNNNNSSKDDTPGGKFAAIACVSCRKLHRKCDKTLPQCAYCVKTGKQCVYPSPRRGKQFQQQKQKQVSSSSSSNDMISSSHQPQQLIIVNQSDHHLHHHTNNNNNNNNNNSAIVGIHQYHHPHRQHSHHLTSASSAGALTTASSSLSLDTTSSSNSSSTTTNNNNNNNNNTNNDTITIQYTPYDTGKTQHELNYKYVATQSLDLYYNILSFGYPLMERERLQALIDNTQKKPANSNMQLWQNKLEQEKDYGLLYSMQALCLQQMGHRDISMHLFQKGKQIVSKFFDEVETINIPIAMKFIAEYLLGSGEKKKARVISSMVKANIAPYLKGAPGSTSPTATKSNSTLAPNSNPNDFSWIDKDPKILPAVLLDTQLKFLDFFLIEEENPNTFIFDELEILGHNKMKVDLNKVGKSCRQLNEENSQKLLAIIKTYECFTDLVFNTLAKKDSLVYLVAQFTNKQVHLEILNNCNAQSMDIGEMLKVAYQIIELTKNAYFPYTPIYACKAVILACTVRLKYNNQGANINGTIDFKDDLRAMRVLANRFSLIQKECGQLIKTIESVLYTQSLTQNNSREMPFSNTSSLMDESNPFHSLLGNFYPTLSSDSAISDILNIAPQLSSTDDIFGIIDSNYDDIFATQILDSFYENSVYETRYRALMEEVMEGSERFSISIQNLIKQQQAQQMPDTIQRLDGLRKLRLDLANEMLDMAKKQNDMTSIIEAELFRRQVLASNQHAMQYLQQQQQQQQLAQAQQQFSQFIDSNHFNVEDYPFDL
ncbi:hypothetical protein C9374_006605 [Naegleria lovaniensis]|uniref:Zn(2)-C6 fungal-type domain-containing protein n=1 Tax=Naegleria lovaniensis TaxID=51637 RepID=A0AA88GJ14_NAELO|nr:uncharacterized protein C9374_006605 [Naegleria lovaniensis]KAG2379488.1 hypothetical protein C9374_006605 [Naegleria lovaniensis]